MTNRPLVNCPDCGATIFGKGTLKRHRGSKACAAGQVARGLLADGWVRAGELASVFRRWPTLYAWHPTRRSSRPEVSRGPVKREEEMWVPWWLLDLVLKGSRTAVTLHHRDDEVTPKERRRAIRVLGESVEARLVVSAEMTLAGDMAGSRAVVLLKWLARG